MVTVAANKKIATETKQWKPRKNKLEDVMGLSKGAFSQVWDRSYYVC